MRGFSLIELMIVVVVIAVLGTLAIPAYQEYVIRAKVTHLFTMAQPAKLAIAEAVIAGSAASVERITNQDVIKDLSVTENTITITGDSEKLGIQPRDKILKITLTPDTRHSNLIIWKCNVEPVELKKYTPADCRG